MGRSRSGRWRTRIEQAARAQRVVFLDTDLVTCTLWDDLLFPGECPPWVREEAERRAQGVALWLLCDTDVPFVPDPQRSLPDAASRERGRKLWHAALEKRGRPFVDIRGDWAERTRAAMAAVERLLAG